MTIRRTIGDCRGLALIEFALTVPFLILLFVGGYQLTDAVSAYRKLTLTTRTIADLASQYTSVTTSEVNAILSASQQVMAPYDADNTSLVVSQVKVNSSGEARVDWSVPRNGTALIADSTVDLPADLKVPGTSLLIAQASYGYVPAIAPRLLGTFTLRDQIVMSPRLSASVERKP